MKWQPISSAPKDGTVVLGFAPAAVEAGEESEFPAITIIPMRWAEGSDGFNWQLPWLGYGAPQYDDLGPGWFRLEWAPTHWMPLPEAPA